MKKNLMILGNALIVLVILALTFTYVSSEHRRMFSAETEAFENMTVAMEYVTTNYLLGGEQRNNDHRRGNQGLRKAVMLLQR